MEIPFVCIVKGSRLVLMRVFYRDCHMPYSSSPNGPSPFSSGELPCVPLV